MTVVIASHDVDEIERYADRVIVLDHGSIVLEGPPDKVFREVEVLDRMFVHVPDLARLGKTLGIDGEQPLSLDVPRAAEQMKTWLGTGKSTQGREFRGAIRHLLVEAAISLKEAGTGGGSKKCDLHLSWHALPGNRQYDFLHPERPVRGYHRAERRREDHHHEMPGGADQTHQGGGLPGEPSPLPAKKWGRSPPRSG